jgi:uncharacterized membrane protein YfcA
VGFLVMGFLVGVTLGALVANRLPGTALKYGFAGLLVLLSARTFLRREAEATGASSGLDLRGLGTWGPLIGLAGGTVSGLTGLGGAVVVVPLLAARFRMTQHQAQLASLMMLLPPIGLPGVVVYARAQGGLPWVLIGGVVAGFAVGAFLGARLATRMRGAHLKQVFAGIMLVMALLVVLK